MVTGLKSIDEGRRTKNECCGILIPENVSEVLEMYVNLCVKEHSMFHLEHAKHLSKVISVEYYCEHIQ